MELQFTFSNGDTLTGEYMASELKPKGALGAVSPTQYEAIVLYSKNNDFSELPSIAEVKEKVTFRLPGRDADDERLITRINKNHFTGIASLELRHGT